MADLSIGEGVLVRKLNLDPIELAVFVTLTGKTLLMTGEEAELIWWLGSTDESEMPVTSKQGASSSFLALVKFLVSERVLIVAGK